MITNPLQKKPTMQSVMRFNYATSSRYSLILVKSTWEMKIVGVGALEHEHFDGLVRLGSLNGRNQIADQFGP